VQLDESSDYYENVFSSPKLPRFGHKASFASEREEEYFGGMYDGAPGSVSSSSSSNAKLGDEGLPALSSLGSPLEQAPRRLASVFETVTLSDDRHHRRSSLPRHPLLCDSPTHDDDGDGDGKAGTAATAAAAPILQQQQQQQRSLRAICGRIAILLVAVLAVVLAVEYAVNAWPWLEEPGSRIVWCDSARTSTTVSGSGAIVVVPECRMCPTDARSGGGSCLHGKLQCARLFTKNRDGTACEHDASVKAAALLIERRVANELHTQAGLVDCGYATDAALSVSKHPGEEPEAFGIVLSLLRTNSMRNIASTNATHFMSVAPVLPLTCSAWRRAKQHWYVVLALVALLYLFQRHRRAKRIQLLASQVRLMLQEHAGEPVAKAHIADSMRFDTRAAPEIWQAIQLDIDLDRRVSTVTRKIDHVLRSAWVWRARSKTPTTTTPTPLTQEDK
jgi:hypothetical protein